MVICGLECRVVASVGVLVGGMSAGWVDGWVFGGADCTVGCMLFGEVSGWEVARVGRVCGKVVGWVDHARVDSRVQGFPSNFSFESPLDSFNLRLRVQKKKVGVPRLV